MPRFLYAWRTLDDTWPLRAVIGPVPADVARSVDRVVEPADADQVLADADEASPPPWTVSGSVEAETWEQVVERVRDWHFT